DMPPPWEAYAEEVAAALAAAGSRRVAPWATAPRTCPPGRRFSSPSTPPPRRAALRATPAEPGRMALFFAATRPERPSALVLGNASARYVADDDYPIAIPPEQAEHLTHPDEY